MFFTSFFTSYQLSFEAYSYAPNVTPDSREAVHPALHLRHDIFTWYFRTQVFNHAFDLSPWPLPLFLASFLDLVFRPSFYRLYTLKHQIASFRIRNIPSNTIILHEGYNVFYRSFLPPRSPLNPNIYKCIVHHPLPSTLYSKGFDELATISSEQLIFPVLLPNRIHHTYPPIDHNSLTLVVLPTFTSASENIEWLRKTIELMGSCGNLRLSIHPSMRPYITPYLLNYNESHCSSPLPELDNFSIYNLPRYSQVIGCFSTLLHISAPVTRTYSICYSHKQMQLADSLLSNLDIFLL